MLAVIAALHVIGWVTLVAVVEPAQFVVDGKAFGIGIGLTAYTLGLRHAFDADHIAAIDNTTRKLMSDGRRPLAVGFFFSLGHCTVVFALAMLLTVGLKAVVGPVRDDSSALHHYTGLIGTGVSGLFLYLIAALNIGILAAILRVFWQMRSGGRSEAELATQLNNLGSGGPLSRVFGRFTTSITESWQAYPIGVLFGLGFDTATEIALLVVSGTGAAAGLPWYAILCLPILFAAGMCLLDTIDGAFMNFAYGWAFASPVRKLYYNIVITGLSVAVALLVGSLELLALLAARFGWDDGFWSWTRGIDLNAAGYLIVGIFVLTWAGAVLVWRYGRVEQRWAPADWPGAAAPGRASHLEPEGRYPQLGVCAQIALRGAPMSVDDNIIRTCLRIAEERSSRSSTHSAPPWTGRWNSTSGR